MISPCTHIHESHAVPRACAPLLLQILNEKVEVKVEKGKVGSLDNVRHRAGGGDKKVFNDVEYLRQTSAMHAQNTSGSSSRRQSASQVRNNTLSRLCVSAYFSFSFFVESIY